MAAPRRALVVIDVQNEYFTGNLLIEHPPVSQSLPNIGRAMDAARAMGIRVVVVQQNAPENSPIFAKGSHGWQLHDEVGRRPHSHRIEKNFPSVYTGTDFAQWLETNGIDTLSVVGYMTHNCVGSTLIEAAHRGLQAEFLSDATGSLAYANDAGRASAEEIHRVFSVVFHSRFAAVTSTDGWIAAIQKEQPILRSSIPASYAAAKA